MVRNALWRRVELVARDDLDGLVALEAAAAESAVHPPETPMTRDRWETALDGYYDEHDEVLTDADARGPQLFTFEAAVDGVRRATQTLHDPAGHHDWVVEAVVDLAASDEVGEAVVLVDAMRRLGG
ncbi:DUF3516 domain-containing protein [Nocardioides sp. TF02-7]|uniref:DUF3516 domain-containing protein n=1 Tax=Nocardioides sp. TF02-7 TaxID=2917724 RepID=UPI0031F5350F